jgi:ribosomal protein S19
MNACRFFKRAKKALPAIIGLAAIVLNGNPAWSEDQNLSVQVGEVLKFSAGVVSAFMIHEGAHYLAGEITGTDIDWELGNYNQPIGFTEESESDADGVIVNSAGLVSQAIGSEIILQVDRIDKNDNFVRGMRHDDLEYPQSDILCP